MVLQKRKEVCRTNFRNLRAKKKKKRWRQQIYGGCSDDSPGREVASIGIPGLSIHGMAHKNTIIVTNSDVQY